MEPRRRVPTKQKQPEPPRRWRWIFSVLALVMLLFWWALDEEPEEARASTPTPTLPVLAEVIAPAPVAAAVPDAAVAPVVQVADAAVTIEKPVFDAGLSEQFRIEEIMRRWREALAPLFRVDRRQSNKPPAVIATSSEGKEPSPPETKCESGVTHFPMRAAGAVDFVVAIDTSGSMYGVLPEIVQWLSNFELALREKGVDFQLIVVADHRTLNRRTVREVDGGQIQAWIGSSDAMETLIKSARLGPLERWTARLRTTSVKHLIVVTDDEASDKRGLPYLAPLIEAASGTLGTVEAPAFSLHLLGGFQPPKPEEVLPMDAPLVSAVCPLGEAAGLGYQRLAQVTGGLRASLCYRESMRALTRALVEWPVLGGSSCVWLLRPKSTVVTVWAERRPFTSRKLWESPTASSCYAKTDSFLVSGPMLGLCESTCAVLTDAGFDTVQVLLQCEP